MTTLFKVPYYFKKIRGLFKIVGCIYLRGLLKEGVISYFLKILVSNSYGHEPAISTYDLVFSSFCRKALYQQGGIFARGGGLKEGGGSAFQGGTKKKILVVIQYELHA